MAASHIAEKFIFCFQKCSWSILYMTGRRPSDYNLWLTGRRHMATAGL